MHVTVNNKLPTAFDCYTAVIVRAKHDKMHNCYMHPFVCGNWLEFKKNNTSRYAIVLKLILRLQAKLILFSTFPPMNLNLNLNGEFAR